MSPRLVAVYNDCQNQKINFCELSETKMTQTLQGLCEANISKDCCHFLAAVQPVSSTPACLA